MVLALNKNVFMMGNNFLTNIPCTVKVAICAFWGGVGSESDLFCYSVIRASDVKRRHSADFVFSVQQDSHIFVLVKSCNI